MPWWTSIISNSIIKIAGKIIDRIPGREESIRNKIDSLKRKRDELLKDPHNPKFADSYKRVIDELSRLEATLKNR